ncbi:MAG: DUF134 domain-containing protein [Candidatus Omnitrophica bacterium]|nr:DUF134 domain-containing protein [Candidatus Omnitrophota bacterium]
MLKKNAKIGRPIKARIIGGEPRTKQFSPRGRVGRPGYKEIKLDEFEAIKITDYMGLNQREASKHMGISQQTFSRVLRSGRKCLAEALINGEIIKVHGGVFKVEKMPGGH